MRGVLLAAGLLACEGEPGVQRSAGPHSSEVEAPSEPAVTLVPVEELAKTLPSDLEGYHRMGEPFGTRIAHGPEARSEAGSRWRTGRRRLTVRVVDAGSSPELQPDVAHGDGAEEGTPHRGSRSVEVLGHPGMLRWYRTGGGLRAELLLLVADRFRVEVELDAAADPSEALDVVREVDLRALAREAAGTKASHGLSRRPAGNLLGRTSDE